MEPIITTPQISAVFLARVILGILFFFQGYDAVFGIKIKNVIAAYQYPFAQHGITRRLTILGTWYTSCVELVGGALLLLGLFKTLALYLLGIDLIIASLAFSVTRPMWDMRHVMPRLMLLVFLLLIPVSWDQLSLDYLFNFPFERWMSPLMNH